MGKRVNSENKLDQHTEIGQIMKNDECWRSSRTKEAMRGKARVVLGLIMKAPNARAQSLIVCVWGASLTVPCRMA